VLCFQTSKPWGPNALFRYPINGTGAIWQAVANALPAHRFRLARKVEAIDAAQQRLTLSGGGDSLHYDRLISTMPMDRLLTLVPPPETLATSLVDGFM
jgi:protoporphyrinogen oxidase